jgi:hypothetical protein
MKALAAVAGIAALVLVAHLSGLYPVFRAHVTAEPGWPRFRADYGLSEFGDDGHFVRAAQNGYNVFYFTHRYAWRFTRRTQADANHACSSCHRPEDLAYAFVNSDRYDPSAGKRLSFEEHVMRCFAQHMDGYVPTLYDPTVRDLRILARAVAHHMQLGEGALPTADNTWRAAR